MNSPDHRLQVSLIVVCHNMAAQIENTLYSLLPPYQRDITSADYEIILMDNGSSAPLDERLQNLSPNLRYVYLPPAEARPNPAAAMNRGAALARASRLCLMIDGARMLTPGVLSWGLRLMALAAEAVVEVRGWHLGPKWQPESVMDGYDHETETRLLAGARWRENGYRLWNIAAATPQSRHGFSAGTAESNCLFMSRALFARIGGFDERSRVPGGGLVNLDFFARAVAATEHVFTILGEGTFHQVHGGAATGLAEPVLNEAITRWREESAQLGHTIAPEYEFILAGHLPVECARWLSKNGVEAT